jgi:hypothetical protein
VVLLAAGYHLLEGSLSHQTTRAFLNLGRKVLRLILFHLLFAPDGLGEKEAVYKIYRQFLFHLKVFFKEPFDRLMAGQFSKNHPVSFRLASRNPFYDFLEKDEEDVRARTELPQDLCVSFLITGEQLPVSTRFLSPHVSRTLVLIFKSAGHTAEKR